MTNAKKIEILNGQLLKLQITEASLNIFHVSNWKTETLEYIRVFFGEDSELYRKCNKYNEDIDEEHKTKDYTTGSALWIVYYTDMLFSAIGILQHELHKKSKFAITLRGFTLGGVIGIIATLGTITYFVGKSEGIELGRSLGIEANDKPQQHSNNKTTQQSEQNHIDTNKMDSVK